MLKEPHFDVIKKINKLSESSHYGTIIGIKDTICYYC